MSRTLPYCDVTKQYTERVADIISRVNLTQKIGLLSPATNGGSLETCVVHTEPVPEIGLPTYRWLTETNSAVSVSCIDANRGKCPTVFVGPTGMAASFNRTSWFWKGDVVSTDMRVLSNGGKGVGLSGFGPNINIVKE